MSKMTNHIDKATVEIAMALCTSPSKSVSSKSVSSGPTRTIWNPTEILEYLSRYDQKIWLIHSHIPNVYPYVNVYSGVVRVDGPTPELHDLQLFTKKMLPITKIPNIIECRGDKCRLSNEHVACQSCGFGSIKASRVKIGWLSKPKVIPYDFYTDTSYGDKPIIMAADRLEVTEYVRT